MPVKDISNHHLMTIISSPSSSFLLPTSMSSSLLVYNQQLRHHPNPIATLVHNHKKRYRSSKKLLVVASSTSNSNPSIWWDSLKPDKSTTPKPSLSDIIWPSTGAFAAMAILGKIDQFLIPRGISMTIAPLGAVCAVLFIAPSSPAARKYNMFMAQIGCAAIGVIAFALLGPGWLARSAALAASIAFMIYTGSSHPPAASLPILFIDGAKLHHLGMWYALFPGLTACILLCFIQEIVCYLKDNFSF